MCAHGQGVVATTNEGTTHDIKFPKTIHDRVEKMNSDIVTWYFSRLFKEHCTTNFWVGVVEGLG